MNIFSTRTRNIPQKRHKTDDTVQMSNRFGNPRVQNKNTVIHVQN